MLSADEEKEGEKTAVAIIVTLVLAVGAEILLISRSDGGKTEKKQQKKQSKKNQESLTKEEGASSVVGKNFLQVRLPKSLFDKLQKKKRHEDVDMDQLVTYLLMRGLSE